MRIVIAGILGGIVMFVWGALAHTALPLGQQGMHLGTPSKATLSALAQDSAGAGAGIYMLPSPTNEVMGDEKAMEAFAAEHGKDAYAFVVYQPGGNPAMTDMGPNLIRQFGSDTLAALLAAFVMSLGALGFGKRVMIAGTMGLFSWLTTNVPYWNWYGFPLDFTVAGLIELLVGWLLAGAAMAWWLGRKGR
ncbi:MAG: hypothetical protein KDI75_12265 [Xanthomonadales bacterium]|nr:hypothetical protein [Xanthomonadales bacterium]